MAVAANSYSTYYKKLALNKDTAHDVIAARSTFLSIRLSLMQQIRTIYAAYADDLAEFLQQHTMQSALLDDFLNMQKEKMATSLLNTFASALQQIVEAATNPSKNMLLAVMAQANVDLHHVHGEQDSTNVLRIKFVDKQATLSKQAIENYYVRVNKEAWTYYTTTSHIDLSAAIWKNAAKTQLAIRDIIQKAIAAKANSFETASLLKNYIKHGGTAQKAIIRKLKEGGIKKYYVPKDVKYEAFRVVRTETSDAYAEATYRGGQANPFYTGIDWILSASHVVTDVCDDYASQRFFKKGSEPFVPHPQCICTQVPVYQKMTQSVDATKQWLHDASSQPDIEKWFNEQFLTKIAPQYRSMFTASDIIFSKQFDEIALKAGWSKQQLALIRQQIDDALVGGQKLSASKLAAIRRKLEKQFAIPAKARKFTKDIMQAWFDNSSDLVSSLKTGKLLMNYPGFIAEKYTADIQKDLTFRAMFAQRYAKLKYGDTITLYRGVFNDDIVAKLADVIKNNKALAQYINNNTTLDAAKLRKLLGKDADKILKSPIHALSSWTSDIDVTSGFGDVILKQQFNTSDIFTLFKTDPVLGKNTKEFIMMSFDDTIKKSVFDLLATLNKSEDMWVTFIDQLDLSKIIAEVATKEVADEEVDKIVTFMKQHSDISYVANSDAHDTTLAQILKAHQFDKTPTILPDAEFEKQKLTTIYRGFAENEAKQFQYSKQFAEGKYFVGKGLAGNGTYFAEQLSTAESYIGKVGSVIKCGFDAGKANIIKLDDLLSLHDKLHLRLNALQIAAFKAHDEVAYEFYNELSHIIQDPGRLAALLGYDAINSTEIGNIYVVLNRGMLKMSSAIMDKHGKVVFDLLSNVSDVVNVAATEIPTKYLDQSYEKEWGYSFNVYQRINQYSEELNLNFDVAELDDIKDAVASWTGSGYRAIRQYQLAGDPNIFAKQYAKILEDLIAKLPTVQKGAVVYRGFPMTLQKVMDLKNALKVGDHYLPGQGTMFSSSIDYSIASSMYQSEAGVFITIDTTNTTTSAFIAPISEHAKEMEVLFSSKADFIVTAIKYDEKYDKLFITLRQIA